jgi:hypothetical protein
VIIETNGNLYTRGCQSVCVTIVDIKFLAF